MPTPHDFSSGVGPAAPLHLIAVIPGPELLEFDPTGTALYEDLFVEPLEVEGGKVKVPAGPGLGVELTPNIIERYRL